MCQCDNGCNHMADGSSHLTIKEKEDLKKSASVRLMALSESELDSIIHQIDQTYWCHYGKMFDNPNFIFDEETDNGFVGILPDMINNKDWKNAHNRVSSPNLVIISQAQEVFRSVFVPAVLRTTSN